MTGAVLTLNAGSSSLKHALFRRSSDGTLKLLAQDTAEAANGAAAGDGRLGEVLAWADQEAGQAGLAGVGHRVVHGGAEFSRPVRLTTEVLAALEGLTPLAPLHQPRSLAPIRATMKLRPDLPQVACFDTAFHQGLAPVVRRFALPRRFEDAGVRRYGFHGLSFEFVARRLRETAPTLAAGRVVVAHLGNGASLCAMRDGQSVDVTMGFTALDGLVMGTRCGSIDAGVLLYMLQQQGLSAKEVEHVLYHESGLLGVSGLSADMRALTASTEPRAKEAIELFVFRIARETGALAATLGGLDGFVFTGGIGEHAPAVRDAVCQRLRWLGVEPGPATATDAVGRISADGSPVEVHVIPTDEEVTIAGHTMEALTGGQPAS